MVKASTGSPYVSSQVLRNDLQFANDLIAQAMTKSSWRRNKSWALKFEAYVRATCPSLRDIGGMRRAVLSNRLVLAFLAHVVREKPKTKTCVDAAKRAVNFLRSLLGAAPIDSDPNVRLLARSVRHSFARSVRQSPAFPMVFAKVIVNNWGASDIWWQRMITVMVIMALYTMTRGAEIVSCRREGIVWVRPNGTQVRSSFFNPARIVGSVGPALIKNVQGFMVLFPSRKNHQSTPTWVPVISAAVVSLLAKHIQWLDQVRGPISGCLFPARRSMRNTGMRVYTPKLSHESSMSVDSLRLLVRQALIQCCRLSTQQTANFGTHSLRIEAMEILRSKGVPAEIRQQATRRLDVSGVSPGILADARVGAVQLAPPHLLLGITCKQIFFSFDSSSY